MADERYTQIAENLMKLRVRRGKSLKEVAEAVGISYNALSTYEKATKTPPLDFAIRLADYYGVALDELCGRTQKGFWDHTEYFDCQRAYIALRKMGLPQEVKVEQVPWRESKELMEPEAAAMYKDMEEVTGEVQTFRKTTFTIHSHRFSSFVEAYEKMLGLVKDGLIDEQIFSEWLEKKLSEPQV